MNIGSLKSIVAAYHKVDPSKFVINGEDLILHALNNARRQAEIKQSFNSQQIVARLEVAPEGTLLSTAVNDETDLTVSVKDFETFYLVDPVSGGLMPMYHHPKKNLAVWTKERIRNSTGWDRLDPYRRYRADWYDRFGGRCIPIEVYFGEQKVFLNPTQAESKTVKVDCSVWMQPYLTDDDTDWMLEDAINGGTGPGVPYLQWAAICELNYRENTFTPGLDGNLSPPEKRMTSALEDLIAWDSMYVENGRQPRGIR